MRILLFGAFIFLLSDVQAQDISVEKNDWDRIINVTDNDTKSLSSNGYTVNMTFMSVGQEIESEMSFIHTIIMVLKNSSGNPFDPGTFEYKTASNSPPKEIEFKTTSHGIGYIVLTEEIIKDIKASKSFSFRITFINMDYGTYSFSENNVNYLLNFIEKAEQQTF